jgi:hypothetical protein
MSKKKRDQVFNRKFNSEDIKNWQELANEDIGGNLTTWVEIQLNNVVKQRKKPS